MADKPGGCSTLVAFVGFLVLVPILADWVEERVESVSDRWQESASLSEFIFGLTEQERTERERVKGNKLFAEIDKLKNDVCSPSALDLIFRSRGESKTGYEGWHLTCSECSEVSLDFLVEAFGNEASGSLSTAIPLHFRNAKNLSLTELLQLAGACPPTVPERRGQGDEAEAQVDESILRAAERGDAEAQVEVAYSYGRDEKSAARWFLLAAEQGHGGAQWQLGFMYLAGSGVPQDYVSAHMWWNLAAGSGQIDGIALKDARRNRDDIARRLMTSAQVAEAKARALARGRPDQR